MPNRLALLAVAAALTLAAPAGAKVRLPTPLPPVAGNPADRLAALPIEPFRYDPASRCAPKARRGTRAFVEWLQANAAGAYWGAYRCERWSPTTASLHAENRAVDWHLDRSVRAERLEAKRLILLLLAPDEADRPQALARRMGVQEVIWDCGYWASGMTRFAPYRVCYDERGRLRDDVDATAAHRDHVHFGLTRAGSRGRTSFWSAG